MRRREFITLLGGAATVGWPLAASAQQVSKSYRVAFLALVGDEDAEIVKQRLGELGYIEGKNLNFDYRSAEGQLERLPQLAAEPRRHERHRLQQRASPLSSPVLAIRLEQGSSRA